MIRIITQILIGLMLIFGTFTLAPRAVFHLRAKAFARGLYLSAMIFIMLFFSVMAFYFAYSGIRELWR